MERRSSSDRQNASIFESGAMVIFAQVLVMVTLMSSLIAFLVMPCVGWNVIELANKHLVLVTASILHVLAFGSWFFITVLVGADVEEVV